MAKKTGKDLFAGDVPKMPEGYYTGDKPNLRISEFLKKYAERAKHPSERFAPKPYLPTIKASKANPVYNMHAYPSKKPFDAIEQYVLNFSLPGEVILDPFVGSGGTLYCAVKHNRIGVGIDISPAATFIAKGLCTPFDPDIFSSQVEALVKQLEAKFGSMFETTCGYCSGSAEIRTVAWSMVFRCSKCLKETPLAEASENEEEGKGRCSCGETLRIKDKMKRWTPVRVEYLCHGECNSKRLNHRYSTGPNDDEMSLFARDKQHILELENSLKAVSSSFPEFEFPERARVQVLRPRGIEKHSQVYSNRNRAVAESLWALIEDSQNEIRDVLRFWFSASILSLTLFERDREGGGGNQSGTMYIPYNCKDRSPFSSLRSKKEHIEKGLKVLSGLTNPTVFLSTQDSSSLEQIPSNSIDYIFTDPPYGDKVQYWELNCIWEAWLQFNRNWAAREAVINFTRGLDEKHWEEVIRASFSEIYRVLRPGRYMSVCFHGTDLHWSIFQDICCEIGFLPDQSETAIAIDSKQKSFKQLKTNEDNVRKDLVVNFRKPFLGELNEDTLIRDNEDSGSFSEKVRSIIKNCLSQRPGLAKDKIFDEVVSHMVRAGRMEAHNFEGLLRQVAEEVKEPVKKTLYENEDPNIFGTHEVSRWYLKETEFAETDAAESAKEDAAAEKVEKFIEKRIKDQPWMEGVHYSDIFEQYIYSVKDKPRRQLADWLLDYFYKTDAGTYRLPQSEEEKKLKAEGRTKGTHRRVKRFIAYLQQGVPIPPKEQPNDATLAEWLRYCKRSGLYEQGKLLYEKGGLNLDNLSEKDMVNAEEDYQVCVRLLARGAAGTGAETTPKRGRKKK